MYKIYLILVIIISSISFKAQESNLKELTIEDAVLGYYKGLYPRSMNGIKWTDNNLLAIKNNKNKIEIFKPTGSKRKNFLSPTSIDSSYKYISNWNIENKNHWTFFSNSSFIETNNGNVTKIKFSEKAQNISISPNKNQIAYTLDNNLFFANSTDSIIAITKNESKEIISGQAIHRFEFGISKGIFWSPNSSKIAFYEKDESDVADYPLLDISKTPGKLKSIKYPMAGQNSEYGKVGIYDLNSKKTIYLNVKNNKDDYVTNLTWGPDSKYIYIAELNRDQNHLKWNKFSSENGEFINNLYEEKNDKWVEHEFPSYFLNKQKSEFVTLSERDGFMNIYHYNVKGELIKQITNNKWVVTSILGIDEETNTIYYTGTGKDPREMHAFSVNIKTLITKKITKENGVHRVKISPNYKYLIDQYSSINEPAITQIISLSNDRTIVIDKSINPLENYSIGSCSMIELETEKNWKLYGRLIKPSNFNSNKKYPVLVYVYGGPHAQLVTNNWLGGASLWMHWMAEQGYLVFTLDGRGSANRGFDFESSIHRQLGTLEIEDQLIGVNYLKSLNYVDSSRLAVHGWSYGGFMTTSLMTRTPGVFTTGVGGGPVIDWKWYEIMYGERYMDTPDQNLEGYNKASLLNYVKNLKGKLLLIHGTNDDVVVMQHNLAYVQECVKKGIQMDFFPYPMHPHNVRGKDRVHLMTKVLNYIIDNNYPVE
ncbi:MAG: peptidase S9 [Crocinitomicaceae bacterium]|nr:peptidase S9 [Crocinitomicaceae bacterium]